jgi:hypothetical protein
MSTTQVPTKSQTSKNAVTHGLYASEVVLPEESQKEFDDLLEAYRDEYCPHGISEHATVDELAILHWKRRRLETGLQQALQRVKLGRADSSDVFAKAASTALTLQLKTYLHATASLAKQSEKVCQTTAPTVLPFELQQLTAALEKFGPIFADLLSLFRRADEQRYEDIVQTFLPDILERELKIQAEIDRRVEKLLKRLANIKTYKQLCVPRPANANQIEAAANKPDSATDS